jgi:hypothetical protein
MTFPNLSEMEEVLCEGCRTPLILTPVEGTLNRYVWEGCRCGQETFRVPDFVVAGFGGGPLLVYVPKRLEASNQ